MPRPALNRFMLPALILPTLAVAACAPVDGETDYVSRAPAANAVGPAQSCIDTQRIRSQTVQDDRTIDFKVGRQVYRNTLRTPCPGLRINDGITYQTYNTKLCSPEIVYSLQTIGGNLSRGAGCSLGEFVPVEYIDRDADVMGE